jgi:hypothetical protein
MGQISNFSSCFYMGQIKKLASVSFKQQLHVSTFKLVNVINVVGHMMRPHHMMFEVHHGGTIDRQHRIHYVGGLVSNYSDTYDPSKLKFFDIEDIYKTYGYRFGDLVYYNVPGYL